MLQSNFVLQVTNIEFLALLVKFYKSIEIYALQVLSIITVQEN